MNETSALNPISRSPVQELESIHNAPVSVEWTTSPLTNHSEREQKIQEKYGLDPQTGLKERGLRFNNPEEGPAWAVEAYIPLTDTLRKALKSSEGGGVDIPPHITGIVYLDLSPQESIYPAKYRTIETNRKTKNRGSMGRGVLDQLRAFSEKDTLSEFFAFIHVAFNTHESPEYKKAAVFGSMLKNVFENHKEKLQQFNALLERSKGQNLVIVFGHGGGEKNGEHIMGEQFPDTVMNGEDIAQRMGNRIFTSEIIDLYNNPKEYAAIFFSSCNMEGAKIEVKNVPIVHPMGPAGMGIHPLSNLGIMDNKSYIVVPKSTQGA